MNCATCQKELNEGAKFCGGCGSTQATETRNITPVQNTEVNVNQGFANVNYSNQSYEQMMYNQACEQMMQSLQMQSTFDGGLLQLIWYRFLGGLITILTLGICLPYAYCLIYSWEAKHTVINGRRLSFTGTALGLFGSWFKWWLLTIVTLGIFGLWIPIMLKKWKTKHTHLV